MQRFAITAVLAVVVSGCFASSFRAPDQFVELESSRSSVKFVASDDARLWIRRFTPEADGTLAFWREHVRLHFTTERGYTLISERDVKIDGAPGVEFTFEATVDGVLQRYALFLTTESRLVRDRVVTAEFVGTPETFAAHEAAVRTALRVE